VDQSIGFTANLSADDSSGAEAFLPFFTPNGKRPPDPLELVEPSGEWIYLSQFSSY
jgi:hypothetical protein